MKTVEVNLEWCWIDWDPSDTWFKNVYPKLRQNGISENELLRSVYIIKANGVFAIEYPTGISPTLYIGEGSFKDRITQHKNWLYDLDDLVGDFAFKIGICIPRVKNNLNAYLDLEAALLIAFKEEYGSAPIRNDQMETRRHENYQYLPEDEFRSAFMIGKGVRYKWAIKPMPSSDFYDHYNKTWF